MSDAKERPGKGQGEGARLREGPARELAEAAFAIEIADAPILHEGLSLTDLAHVLMMIEIGVIPPAPGELLLRLLLELDALPLEELRLNPNLEDVYSNREAWVRGRDEDAAGWLGAGRPRREPATIASRMAVRARLLELGTALAAYAGALVDQAAAHVDTVMPDYTYLQPATPTSLAHYLLSFTFPVLRDLERLRECFARTNQLPGGIGNINGSRLPLDRKRLADLLGFDAVISNTRDAMWQVDQPIEVMALLTAAMLSADRLAEDLQIWNTREFGFIELADRHTRISLIMPQKKNPYSLAFVRGISGIMIGRLTSMAAVAKSPSGQMDNRIFAIGEVPRALDQGTRTMRLLAEVVRGARFDTERMRAAAGEGFTQAMDLAETIMQEAGVSYRSAHRIVGTAVRMAHERSGSDLREIPRDILTAAAEQTLGRPVEVSDAALAALADPAQVVRTRTGLGGAAAEPVHDMIAECRAALAVAEKWQRQTEDRLRAGPPALRDLARERARDPDRA